MNQKRSCPGVPNKYRTWDGLRVIRPKSRATVVVALFSTPSSRSVAALTAVSISSVLSGSISLSVLTKVVFPTPNPPATSTLIPTGRASAGGWSQSFEEGIAHRFQKVSIR